MSASWLFLLEAHGIVESYVVRKSAWFLIKIYEFWILLCMEISTNYSSKWLNISSCLCFNLIFNLSEF